MEHRRIDIPTNPPVASLCWNSDDTLVDWAGGIRVLGLDGAESPRHLYWGYSFDATVQSPSGRYAAIYQRLGTKAAIVERGRVVRELNRSFYFAEGYHYPIVLFTGQDGRELVAHCPEQYNRIEIEDVRTGQRLTSDCPRETDDVFHSRLTISPGGRWLLSAGWIWHPINFVAVWNVADALLDGRVLDRCGAPGSAAGCEIDDAAFIDDDRLLLSANPDSEAELVSAPHPDFSPGSIGIFDLRTGMFESVVRVNQTVGEMFWVGDGLVVGFYGHPRLFDLRTGRIVLEWPELATGERSGCIGSKSLPPIALDAGRRRFAVASGQQITVIEFPT